MEFITEIYDYLFILSTNMTDGEWIIFTFIFLLLELVIGLFFSCLWRIDIDK